MSKNQPEKNIESKQTMDSTPISDIMGGHGDDLLEPPMMSADPRMTQMHMQAPMMMQQQQPMAQQVTIEFPFFSLKNLFKCLYGHTSDLFILVQMKYTANL